MAIASDLLTADDFRQLPEDGHLYELVRGCAIMMVRPGYRHGRVCGEVVRLLGNYYAQHALGTVIGNDAGVITQRDPDTVRGPDVAFYSFARVPRDADPVGYPDSPPEIVFEVLSPHDRWSEVLSMAGEYLQAGVSVVCILDPEARTATVCRADGPPLVLAHDQDLALPELHAEFRVPVAQFFG
ncbi:MAG: Uma2 family endonuclease [Pirellulales bacterium]